LNTSSGALSNNVEYEVFVVDVRPKTSKHSKPYKSSKPQTNNKTKFIQTSPTLNYIDERARHMTDRLTEAQCCPGEKCGRTSDKNARQECKTVRRDDEEERE